MARCGWLLTVLVALTATVAHPRPLAAALHDESNSVPSSATSSVTPTELNDADVVGGLSSPLGGRDPFNALALLLLPLLCFIGLVGNAFVCVAIATDRRLQNVTNYFLFSLAAADLLVCSVVMPLSIIVEVKRGDWTWTFELCLFYVYADVFLCSASIVHMSIISLDRYLGISQPLKMRNKSRTAIVVKIAAVWLITVVISCPIAVVALHDNSAVLDVVGGKMTCAIHNRAYKIYGSTLSFLIPLLIMLVTYVRTTGLLKRQAAILSQTSGSRGASGLRRAAPPRKLGQSASIRRTSGNTNSSVVCSGAGNSAAAAAAAVASNNNNTSVCSTAKQSTASTYQSQWYQSTATSTPLAHTAKSSKSSPPCSEDMTAKAQVRRIRSRTSSYFNFFVNKVNKSGFLSSNQELLAEHKATRVLAVVFVCFFICWTPFFAINLLDAFATKAFQIPDALISLSLWLGYISSTVNPLIYTVFNKRFRKAFIRILRGQCCSPRAADFTSGYWSRTHTIMPDNFTYSNYDRGISRDDTGGGVGRTASVACGDSPSPYATTRSVAFAQNSNDWSPTSCRSVTSAGRNESEIGRLRKLSRPCAPRSSGVGGAESDASDEVDSPLLGGAGRNDATSRKSSSPTRVMPPSAMKRSTTSNGALLERSSSSPHMIRRSTAASSTSDAVSPLAASATVVVDGGGGSGARRSCTLLPGGKLAANGGAIAAAPDKLRRQLLSVHRACSESIDEHDSSSSSSSSSSPVTPSSPSPPVTAVAGETPAPVTPSGSDATPRPTITLVATTTAGARIDQRYKETFL